jgi:rhomboid protease GluP
MNRPDDLQPRRVSYALPLSQPIVTWILLVIVGAVFVLETLAGGSTNLQVLVRLGAKVNPLIAAGEYWRLLTSMFLHIGLWHILFNGYALVIIGTELERLLGPGRFLAIYLLSGLLGSLASYAFSPSLSAGASGAIFGTIGALAAFFTTHRRRLGAWGRRRLANIVFLIAINLFFGFTQPGIDNFAHMGGLLSGFGLGWFLAPRYELDPIQLRMVDRNSIVRYWPVLLVTVLLVVGGTAAVTALRQGSPASRLLRAEAAIEREAWQDAILEAQGALAQDPNLAEAHFYLGLAQNRLGQPALAARAYEAVLELEPDFASARWNLALTYYDLKRYDQARTQFETYGDLNPGAAKEAEPYLEELRNLSP